jgi:hypothetical protein
MLFAALAFWGQFRIAEGAFAIRVNAGILLYFHSANSTFIHQILPPIDIFANTYN